MTNKIRTELSGFASISFTTEYKTGELRSALQRHADTLREWAKVNTGGVWVDAEPVVHTTSGTPSTTTTEELSKGIEALGKPDTESFEREILGAIVYLGMALLALEGRV